MFKQYLSLILIVFTFTGCVHHRKPTPPPSAQSIGIQTKLQRSLSAFNQIDVKGQVNLNLHTGYRKPQIILSGDSRDLAQVQTYVSQNTLYVVVGKGFPRFGAINADIRGQFLNRLNYVGVGVINGNALHTNLLDLYLENAGTTKLNGTIGLRTLDVVGDGLVYINGLSSQNLQVHFKGNPKVLLNGYANISSLNFDDGGWLSLYWVKSDHMTIRANNSSRIQLAGMVNRLDVELWGSSVFKGRYLRAQRSFVKTHGRSVAEISSVNHQSTLASDASDIYYYNLPNTRADFMAFNGSVLDMREWEQPFLKDFNRYNKQFP